MIKYNYEVSVNENRAKLNKDIFLFRGNRNIHYYFSIKGARFAFEKEGDLIENANAIYAAVTVIKPNGVEVANAIAPVENGLIHLKVTEDLIDEEVEIGDFDLVFDLFDDSDGAVTIPKIKGQFHVQERPCTTSIGTLSGNVNVVNQAVVDLAIATQENEQLIVVDDDGKYVKTTWVKGDKISIERLNKIEEGIEKNSTQYKDIANELKSLKLVAGDNNTIKLMLGDLELSSLVISGGTVQKPTYGNLVLDNTFLKVQPNGTAQIGIKLDTKPTQDQVVTISESSDILTTDKTTLTFTPSNYDTYQYITVTVGDVSQSETINIIAKNSDELLTESGVTIYIPAQGSEYAVDTTIPSGTYTVQASDFDDTTSTNGKYILLGVYTGTETNIKIPNTINYNNADYKVIIRPSVFKGNTRIQYVTFENNVLCNQYGHTTEDTAGLFRHFENCTSLIGVSNVPVNVKNLNNAFRNCYSLKFVDNLDKLINVTDMNACFYMENANQSQLEYIQDLSKLNICTFMHQTFWNCSNLKRIYGLPNSWNNGTSTFYGCSNLEGDLIIPAGVSDISYSFAKTKKISSITFLNDEITSITNTMFDEYTNTIKLYANEGSTTKATLESTFANKPLVEIYAIGAETSTPKIVTWGDSLTSAKADGWVEKITKRITSHSITNLACSGEFTTSTSVRQGGNILYASAFTIPATTTSVEVTLTSADGYTFGISPVLSTGAFGYNPVSIAGVKGAITNSNNKYYFTRYEEGEEVIVPSQTIVYSETAEKAKLYDVMIIWLGTNSGWDDVADKLITQIDSMVNYFESDKVLIMTQASGYRFRTDERRDTAIEIENRLSTKYGNKYLNIRQYLIDNALTENNLTATDVDTTRISNGRVPASILADADKLNAGSAGGDGVDDTHFNNYGQISICNAVYSKLQELGYID